MDERLKTPEDELVESDNLHHVMDMLETMDQREATVLRMRFGLDDNEPRTLKEIGESLGLTRERVRQIETEALGKLADGLQGPNRLSTASRCCSGAPVAPARMRRAACCAYAAGVGRSLAASPELVMDLDRYIRAIPDFPKPGILFRDITPLLANAGGVSRGDRPHGRALSRHADRRGGRGRSARVHLRRAAWRWNLNVGFVPVRKPGKLPFDTHAFHYELEYGTDTLEIHRDGIAPGQNVLLVDDLLATGGTIEACCRLVEKSGAKSRAASS